MNDKSNITQLTYSDNPLERVKARLLSRIEAIEAFPTPVFDATRDAAKSRVEALATAIAEINEELELEGLLENRVASVVEKIEQAFEPILRDHEARQ